MLGAGLQVCKASNNLALVLSEIKLNVVTDIDLEYNNR